MSNISEPFDIRKVANEILGTALPPTPRWYDECDNVTRLGAALVKDGYDAEQLQRFYEKPWKWTAEFEAMRATERCHHSLTALADEPAELEAAVTDRLIDDVGDEFGARERDDRWDGPQ